MSMFPKLFSGGVAVVALIYAPHPAAHVRLADAGPARIIAVAPIPAAIDPVAIDPSPTVIIDRMTTGSIPKAVEPDAPSAKAVIAPPVPPLAPLELLRFQATALLYRKGATAAADGIAERIDDPVQRVALEWIALKSSGAPDGARLARFAHAHPDWPDAGWIGAVEEASLFSRRAPAAEIDAAFAAKPPATTPGALAFARAALSEGRVNDAQQTIVALWRDRDLDASTEATVLKEFGGLLSRADHKHRADRLLYAEKAQAAWRAAQLAGPDMMALARARLEAAVGPLSPRTSAAVPAALQSDPGLLFAKIQDARRSNRTEEATALFARAPHDAGALIDPDKWWSERRMVAREWLDKGDNDKAYALCAGAVTVSSPAQVDAAFHAGWIALRFLHDPERAAKHFDAGIAAALTPLSIARAYYWRGRAADAMADLYNANIFYANSASYPIAYYGQLAARRLGRPDVAAPRTPKSVAFGSERWLATQAAELYFEAGLDDYATPLAYAAAGAWRDEAQLAALGDVIAAHANAPVAVSFGKIATERGYALDAVAFPLNGAPAFTPLTRAADAASVLGVARQESEFIWHAASGAGAKGLMQVLPSTAQYAARRAGVGYDYGRLISDPAYNLQLGSAYLGELIDDEGGSVEMALAAYNAGAGRVAQWVQAFGDPRTAAVDPVDWIERIPFDETRDYVERVAENIAVYRARLAQKTAESDETLARQ
jgi:soluble lytic murein transglycosylase